MKKKVRRGKENKYKIGIVNWKLQEWRSMWSGEKCAICHLNFSFNLWSLWGIIPLYYIFNLINEVDRTNDTD